MVKLTKITNNFVTLKSKRKNSIPFYPDKHVKSLNKITSNFLCSNQKTFDNLINKTLRRDNIIGIFSTIYNDVLKEKPNWGRVISIYTFAGELVKKVDKKPSKEISNMLEIIIDTYYPVLVKEEGDWDYFCKTYSNSIFKNIFFTIVLSLIISYISFKWSKKALFLTPQ